MGIRGANVKSSQFKGVSYHLESGKWRAYINLGYFDSEEEANSQYQIAMRKLGKTDRQQHSKYKGVTYNNRSQKWQAYIYFNGTTRHVGYYDSEQLAAMAYNEAAKILGMELNQIED